ncbi:YfdX family protein [Bacillus sp. HC-TM]
MPLKQTRNALADAQKLLDKKQYYEANLARYLHVTHRI